MKLALPKLDRKLLRDIGRMKMQMAAVSAVLACGVVLAVMANGMYDSLEAARDAYYDEYRMADMAAGVVRAPLGVLQQLEDIPGVRAFEARVSGVGLLDMPGRSEPVSARLVSLPQGRAPRVNDLVLRAGRMPAAARDNEVLVNEAFAEANHLEPGATLAALIYGRRREVTITGIASSPEFVFAVAPGAMLPEPERFGVLWMNREALGRAFDMDGAFNDLVLRLEPGASQPVVARDIDRLLERHGGRGAYGRDRMMSARFMADELSSLKTMAGVLPPFFLLVAAFLLNVSLSRLVATERSNIGLLKSFGYGNGSIALHYAKFALVFGVLGGIIGAIGGRAVGEFVAGVYANVYQIPDLGFNAGAGVYFNAILITLVAALAGSVQAVRSAVNLPPAAALAPPAPTGFGHTGGIIDRFTARLDGKSRMVARRILRFPRRSATTVVGIAMATALMVTTQHFPLSMDRIVGVTFGVAQRMDVMLAFSDAADDSILRDVAHLPGVLRVEPLRTAEVVFEAGSRRERNSISGVPEGATLNRLLDSDLVAVQPRRDGLTLSQNLADKLAVGPGDIVRLTATDGHRASVELPVVAIVKPYLAASSYIEIETLGRLLREPGRVTAAHLLLDRRQREAFSARAKQLPRIVSVSYLDNARESMRELLEQGSGFFNGMFIFFSSLMAAGVAFSSARVTLAEQERDLATLRVLGFGRREASYVLLAEIGALLLIALPVGAVLGRWLSAWLMAQFQTDLFTFPYVTSAVAYARPALFVAVAVMAAALLVRRGVDRLDLVGVLKSRD
ncbi:MAG TPA: FtsX-like permease family protein [Steroidobacteraceae bacterium]|nr:FtsX-like permease family protein [Steroidobacteraceae bacterium]